VFNSKFLLVLIIIGFVLFLGCRSNVYNGIIIAIRGEDILVQKGTISEIKDYADYTEEDLQNMIWFGIKNETSIVTNKGATLEFKDLEVGQIVSVEVDKNIITESTLPPRTLASKVTLVK
jgi:hypothetical protein